MKGVWIFENDFMFSSLGVAHVTFLYEKMSWYSFNRL